MDLRGSTETTIAGLTAHYTCIDLVVEDDGSGPLASASIALYLLAEPERAIDAQALLRESVIPDPPYWALVWTGARAIAALLLEGGSLQPRRVLDLGCGLGLSGLAAAERGARVVFGDYLEEPLEFVRASLARRDLRCVATDGHPSIHHEVRRIDFTCDRLGERFDLILAADVVYDPAHYQVLAEFLDLHLEDDGRVLLTESLRADARVFLDGLCVRGFEDDRRCLWVLEDGRRERTWLHTLRRRPL
ncbi:MAG: methyltransferase domain-containing protein [Deltaproteobacteria bacterium]|nr:methyltransferase domain-containing protein [Deltaproteobacteria bacterium]